MARLILRSTISAAASSGSSVAQMGLTSAISGTLPFTFGHAFKQGDVPSGSYITADSAAVQADVRNRWSDGSVKYAVLSVLAALSATAPASISVQSTTTAPSGSNVAEPSAATLGSNISVTLTGDGAGTYTPQTAATNGITAWNRITARKVREILGPVMSEFHYYVPTSDAHLTLWFYVRVYSSGAIEVETVHENGWFQVASPAQKDYTATVTIGGSSRFSGAVSHKHHTRWSRVDWVGTDPQITPQHDASYLRATKLVPNYGYTSPTSAAFTGFASALNPAPFALGNWETTMGAGGEADTIGPMTQWDALYCTSADSRAYVAVVSNHRGHGRWPVHFRDETTGRPILFDSYQTMGTGSGQDWGTAPPTPTGGVNGGWDTPHHPSVGFLAYLIEGRWSQLETQQLLASYLILDANTDTRTISGIGGGIISCINAPFTTRGAAWSWRTMGQCAAISPSYLAGTAISGADGSVVTQYRTSIQNSMTFLKARYIDGTRDGGVHVNSLGWLGQYDDYHDGTNGPSPQSGFWGSGWMHSFQQIALGHISDLGIEGITQANLNAVRDHAYNQSIRLCGTESTWNFRRAATYAMPYLSNTDTENPTFHTTAAAFTAWKAFFSTLGTISASSGDSLKDHNDNGDMANGSTSSDATGYWAQFLAPLAMAVEHGKTGAAAAFNLVAAASNYNPVAHGANDKPKWGIRSRTLPAWLTGKAVNEWVSLQSPSASSVIPSPLPPGVIAPAGVTDAWCGASLRISGSRYILHGGGHQDYSGNEIYSVNLEADSPAWARPFGPTSNANIVASADEYLDGNPASSHIYGRIFFNNVRDILFRYVVGQYDVGGVGGGKTYGWSWNATNWAAASTYPGHPASGQTFTNDCSYAADPTTGNMYGAIDFVRYKFNSSTLTWSANRTVANALSDGGAGFDTTRGFAWFTQPNASLGANKVLKWNTADNTETLVTLTGTGVSAICTEHAPGIAYDPVIDRLFVYIASTHALYTINPADGVCALVTTTGTAPVSTSGGSADSCFSKLQYVPNLGGLVLTTVWAQPTKFIRTH